MYYLIKYDRDGGESEPIPYETLEEAFNAGENCYDNPQWVSYKLFEERDDDGFLYEMIGDNY
jgi:hypothetical protein